MTVHTINDSVAGLCDIIVTIRSTGSMLKRHIIGKPRIKREDFKIKCGRVNDFVTQECFLFLDIAVLHLLAFAGNAETNMDATLTC